MAKKARNNTGSRKGSEVPQTVRKSTTPRATSSWFTRDGFWGLLLAAAVVIFYQPVWYAGFVWDDDDHLTANPTIVGPLGFKDIWTTRLADISPLTRSTFWLEHSLWGLSPLPYHVVNVFLHAACAILLWRILLRLKVPGAWFGAALWALHPVEVESVAWITEMKNTESGLFFLLSILFFVRGLADPDSHDAREGRWNYPLTLVFAALAMASKSSTVILPVALGLCAWWLQREWRWQNLKTIVPVFLMSIAASALAIWTQALQLASVAARQFVRTWPERLIEAGGVVWFYLGKLIWPHPLSSNYAGWKIDAGAWYWYLPSLLVLAVLFVLWWNRQGWGRPYFFAFAWFLTALLPVLGFFDNPIFRISLVFDHLQYLASMGPLALAGAGLARLANFSIPRLALPDKQRLQWCGGAAVLLILGMVSWQRAWAYESQQTLWTDALEKNPDSWAAHYALGDVFAKHAQADQAIAHFQRAVELFPNYVEAHNNLGLALSHVARVDEAIANYQKALEIDPGYAEAHNNLGNALIAKGQTVQAIDQFETALKIRPEYPEAHNNLGAALVAQGRLNEAMEQYKIALGINPNFAEAQFNLGDTLVAQNRNIDEAIVHLQKALEIRPDYAEAYNSLGLALARKGRMADAATQFQEALRVNPDYASARNNLAHAQAAAGIGR